MELYAGLDLHSRNTYIGIMDKAFNRVFKKESRIILKTSYRHWILFEIKSKDSWSSPPTTGIGW